LSFFDEVNSNGQSSRCLQAHSLAGFSFWRMSLDACCFQLMEGDLPDGMNISSFGFLDVSRFIFEYFLLKHNVSKMKH
jgi:hypothetical protein